ncbi:universal stress protein [Thiocapsa bogorovii]|uniref:universal stress protein n=1 Tax=Thiocapsa bogorovii TaxID=521689 RepID=UPI001E6508E0|nr:universal stress protein [Thiocapsa bogorovii]UHD18492.1 universal stress protein [Thiocapsa bogorovii]
MNRFRNILYVVSATPGDTTVLERAVALAQHNQARLTLLGVVPRVPVGIGAHEGGPVLGDLQSWLVAEREEFLSHLAAPHVQRVVIQSRVVIGTPFIEVIRQVLREGCDLVIKTPEDPGWLDRLFGSEDLHLLRKCPCPLWMIKPQLSGAFECIVAAVDVNEAYPVDEVEGRRALNRQVMEMATSLALSEFADLHVVHAWEPVGEWVMRSGCLSTDEERIKAYVQEVERHRRENLHALMRKTIDRIGPEATRYLKPNAHLVKGWAREEIPALVQRLGADLVVMGTVARTGISGLLIGNTAETILTQLDCSVLAIKPEGFVSPVTLES